MMPGAVKICSSDAREAAGRGRRPRLVAFLLVRPPPRRRHPADPAIEPDTRKRWSLGGDRRSGRCKSAGCGPGRKTLASGDPRDPRPPELAILPHIAPVSPSVHQGYWWLGLLSPAICRCSGDFSPPTTSVSIGIATRCDGANPGGACQVGSLQPRPSDFYSAPSGGGIQPGPGRTEWNSGQVSSLGVKYLRCPDVPGNLPGTKQDSVAGDRDLER
jgi:hypothetical protein